MIQESELGKRIKAYRMKKGLTLRNLKKKPALQKVIFQKSKILKSAPPVSTLIVLAKALEISHSEIFGEKGEKGSISLVKKGERQVVARNGTVFGYSYQTLAHKFYKKQMEPYSSRLVHLSVRPLSPGHGPSVRRTSRRRQP